MENSKRSAFTLSGTTLDKQFGLTKREYFAGLAMQSFISTQCPDPRHGHINYEEMAKKSVLASDELLKALEDGK